MSLFKKTLSCLVILAFLFNLSYSHQCIHGEMDVSLKTVEEEFDAQDSTEYKNIRMAFDFTDSVSSNSSIKEYIKETLLPPVQAFWQASLKVLPRTSRIFASGGMCSGFSAVPSNASIVGYDADIVIFISTVNDSDRTYLTKAAPCGLDMRTNRPTIGFITFNTFNLSLDMKGVTIESHISALRHEITHILGFSRLLYPYFIDPETFQPLTNHLLNKTVNGVEIIVLDLPPLTQRLRKYFKCSTLEGAYLENEGGLGTFGVHFERRIFFNELMTASSMRDQKLTELTLALLEGTGWYKVKYIHAEPMTYGKGQGCAFLDTKCVNPETKEPNFKEFCSPFSALQISWTRRGFGYCGALEAQANSSLISEFDYWGNQTLVTDPFADNCPQVQTLDSLDCEDDSKAGSYWESYGPAAKAFMGTLGSSSNDSQNLQAHCLSHRCFTTYSGGYNLHVYLGDAGRFKCETAGEVTPSNLSRWNHVGGTVICPDPNEFCSQVQTEGPCKGGCYGNGMYYQNMCYCREGWNASQNCARREMVDKCSRCTSDILRSTCYGDECVCNPSNTACQCALGLKSGRECNGNDTSSDDDPNKNSGNKPGVWKILLPVVLIVAVISFVACVVMKKKRGLVKEGNNSLSRSLNSEEYYQAAASAL